MSGGVLVLVGLALAVPTRTAHACQPVVYYDLASPRRGPVTPDVVFAVGEPGVSAPALYNDEAGWVDTIPLDREGIYGLPLGTPLGTWLLLDPETLDGPGELELVATADWSDGDPPTIEDGAIALRWQAEPSTCPGSPFRQHWSLLMDLTLDQVRGAESPGWFWELLVDDQLFRRFPAPEDPGPATPTFELPDAFEGNDELCVEVALYEPRGALSQRLRFPCRDVPARPPVPACGGWAVAFPLLWLPAGLRRRDSRPSPP